MPAVEKSSGAMSSFASSVTASWVTASTRAATSSSERISLPLSTARPRRDMREDVDSSARSMRPLTLSFARSSSSAERPPARRSAIWARAISTHSPTFSPRVPT